LTIGEQQFLQGLPSAITIFSQQNAAFHVKNLQNLEFP